MLQASAIKSEIEMWWPNGLGEQPQYSFTVYLADCCHMDARERGRQMSIVSKKTVR